MGQIPERQITVSKGQPDIGRPILVLVFTPSDLGSVNAIFREGFERHPSSINTGAVSSHLIQNADLEAATSKEMPNTQARVGSLTQAQLLTTLYGDRSDNYQKKQMDLGTLTTGNYRRPRQPVPMNRRNFSQPNSNHVASEDESGKVQTTKEKNTEGRSDEHPAPTKSIRNPEQLRFEEFAAAEHASLAYVEIDSNPSARLFKQNGQRENLVLEQRKAIHSNRHAKRVVRMLNGEPVSPEISPYLKDSLYFI